METVGRRTISSERVTLSWRSWFCYGVGHVMNDICASMWFTYLLVFFHFVLNFDPVSSGTILLIGQVADAFSTPFVGIESDKDYDSWLCKFGRRKTWHLVGTVCILGSFPFIFSPCIGCQNAHVYAQMIYYSAFVIIFQFGWAAVQVSHLALIPELTPNKHQRTQLTAVRYSFTVVSTIFVYVLTWISLKSNNTDPNPSSIGPDDAFKFQIVVYIGLVVGLGTSFIFYWGVKEKSLHEKNSSERNHKTLFQFLKDIKFYQVAVVYMSSRLFVNLIQINIPLYLHLTLAKSAENLAVIPLLMYIGSVIGSSFVHYLNKALGRRISYTFGSLLGIIACAWIKLGHHSDYEIFPISIALGISGSILIVTALGLTADLIGFDTKSGAFVYGSMSFVDKLSNGIAVMAIQYMKCSSCSDYYENVLVFVCGGAALFGIFPVLTIKSRIVLDSDEKKPLLSGESRQILLGFVVAVMPLIMTLPLTVSIFCRKFLIHLPIIKNVALYSVALTEQPWLLA